MEAARQAEAKRLAEEKAERERIREQVIANAKQNPQAAARILMADRGWTSDAQFNCLVNLWNGESDWRWWAENPSSGAYGIPQSLPASKMATFGSDYRTNPITQIKWGLWYIEQAYGSPCNAYSTWPPALRTGTDAQRLSRAPGGAEAGRLSEPSGMPVRSSSGGPA